MLDITSVLLIFCLAGFVLFLMLREKRQRAPPGPVGFPIVGSALSVGAAAHLTFTSYIKKYGPICRVRMFNEVWIVLHGAKLIKEAFNEPGFSGRDSKEAGKFIAGDTNGILTAEGSAWSEQRRFALRNLRDLGFGKTNMEALIMDEVTELVEWIKVQDGQPIQLQQRFRLAVVNALWHLLAGVRFEHDDLKLTSILDQLEAATGSVLAGGVKNLLVLFYPTIAKLFSNWSGWNFLTSMLKPRQQLFQDTIDQHLRTLSEGNPRDFIDRYLEEIRGTEDQSSSFCKGMGESSLQSVIADLFLAGSDTTSTTLSWAVLYLLHYPDVQRKLQDEVDRVVGRHMLPSVTDRKSMPYTEAFTFEVLRVSSIVPLGITHRATEDVEFKGYMIPKGTMVVGNLYSTHHDSEVWGDPDTFRPDRFLSHDGKTILKSDSLIPFSIGRRVCLGEIFARDQIFLFVSTLAQQFNLIPESGKPMPSLASKIGQITLQPQIYSLVMKLRI